MNCEHYLVNNANLEAYGLSITGQVRQANEDSCGFATVPNGELFVVCDGMGGHVGGATASRIAVDQIIEHFKAQLYPNIYEALNDALCRANIQILGAADAEPSLKGMGTTACIVLVNENDAYIAHVGDSRIYLFEAEKRRLFRITKDHSFVQSLVDMGQLDDREAEHHPRKNVIMKALGTKEELKPEVYMSPVQPAKGDMFLICSDGLSGMVDDNGIESILASDQSVEQKVLDLVNNANVPGKGLDNITAQVIKVVESPYPVSNHPDHNPSWRNAPDGGTTRVVEINLDSQQQPLQEGKAPRKKINAKLLALLILIGLLLVGAAGAIGFNYYWNHWNLGHLQSREKELERKLVQKTKECATLEANKDKPSIGKEWKEAEKEKEEISQELEEVRDKISKISKKSDKNEVKPNDEGGSKQTDENEAATSDEKGVDKAKGDEGKNDLKSGDEKDPKDVAETNKQQSEIEKGTESSSDKKPATQEKTSSKPKINKKRK